MEDKYSEDLKNIFLNLFCVINGLVVVNIAIYNKDTIIDEIKKVGLYIFDKGLYGFSWLQVKYNSHIHPTVDHICSKFGCGLELLGLHETEYKNKFHLDVLFKDDTRITIVKDKLVDIKVDTFNENDIDMFFLYRRNDKNGWECVIYDNKVDFMKIINEEVEFPKKSKTTFIYAKVDTWNKSVDFNINEPCNYCMAGNKLFTERFVRYLFETYNNTEVKPGSSYEVKLIDSSITEEILDNNKYLIIDRCGYRVVKKEGAYYSPSEESE
jgi:hypothetical protein